MSSSKKNKTILLVIDPQIDFHPGGSLAVPGANEDSERIASLIKENIDYIDDIFVTQDSHYKHHIAHGVFWENARGEHPAPFTLITHQNVMDGKWFPCDKSLLGHCITYTKYLEDQGKFILCIWPEHCLIGSHGHEVVPVIREALQTWSQVHGREVRRVMKGQNCLTEMYSAIKADFEIPEDPRTQRDPMLMRYLLRADKLIVCGQALSHCVNFTFCDILETWPSDKTDRLVLLTDACSPVSGFEDKAFEFLQKIEALGCTLSTAAGTRHALPRRAICGTSENWASVAAKGRARVGTIDLEDSDI